MQESFSNPYSTPKSVQSLIIALLSVALLSPVLTFFLKYYFNLPGPQDLLPLSLFYLRKGYIFELITYPFIHSKDLGISISMLFSLFFQMAILWFTGSEIARRFGNGRFLWLFFSAALASGLIAALALLLTGSMTLLYGIMPPLFALLSVWMLLMGEQELQLLLFFRIQAKKAVLAIFAITLLINLSYGEIILFLANGSGALYGLLFGVWVCKLTLTYPLPKIKRKKREKKSRSSADIIDITTVSQDPDAIFMDKMLDKISKVGRDGLTPSEKARMDHIVKKRHRS